VFCDGKALTNKHGTECWHKYSGFDNWLCNRCYSDLYRTGKLEPNKRFNGLELLVNITS
jgi:hypothetical protein